ncbi:uncharacterized protein K452DRAFT_290299 [Aplosporella prunicola CBS 121167]|uniref:Uncharacterized protein n=1 Tax=Aplosporella prunicola CBS 121167 TaxID=1176127 RepID=A0A6A6B0K6_9PEZI|nr:uncharacterized protein K452DRAFT_291613 [Aplosporella prunicola CBS 121167]XP_033394360.1 uncharacterized protein K452DRAFT_290299 [Aplosporella prunicola CBS 121167]KAF2137560.1 hypothetical protein K452DRAFT_291613 [Aplosporella prunicola CBS 121167]KAF2138647.1 hypothetical protein K452DRAFT_290299 [Aplosporella prunicola CBS 121167]
MSCDYGVSPKRNPFQSFRGNFQMCFRKMGCINLICLVLLKVSAGKVVTVSAV